MGEDFSRQTRKLTQYGGKKTAQIAFNGCEYRF